MKAFALLCVAMAAVLLGGCATGVYKEELPPGAATQPTLLNLEDIKEMSARGVSDATILNALRASRAVFRLNSKDIIDLQEADVSQAVTDYMLKTPELNQVQRPRYRKSYYYPYPPPY